MSIVSRSMRLVHQTQFVCCLGLHRCQSRIYARRAGGYRRVGVPLLSLLAVAVLAAVHLAAGKVRFLAGPLRDVWRSLAGGVSVADVFVHLFPDRYLLALVGLAVVYGVEQAPSPLVDAGTRPRGGHGRTGRLLAPRRLVRRLKRADRVPAAPASGGGRLRIRPPLRHRHGPALCGQRRRAARTPQGRLRPGRPLGARGRRPRWLGGQAARGGQGSRAVVQPDGWVCDARGR